MVIKKILIITLLIAAILVPCVYALPTTGAATAVGNKNVTFTATGVTSYAYWKYGYVTGVYAYKTVNVSGTGAVSYTERGVPLMAGWKIYFEVCDSTGCGAELSTTLLNATPLTQTTFGIVEQNIANADWNASAVGSSIIQPYLWVSPISVFWFMVFFFIYTGMWLRQRELIIPAFLGLIASGFIMVGGTNAIGLPPEVITISQSLFYASIAGVIFGLFKR